MGLVAGHGGGAVVQDDQGEVVVVVHGVDQAGQSRVEKGGIADKGNDFLVRGLGKTAGGADGRSHADEKISHGQRRQESQGVAADVRGIDRFEALGGLFHRVVGGPMGAAGAQVGRTLGDFRHIGKVGGPAVGIEQPRSSRR